MRLLRRAVPAALTMLLRAAAVAVANGRGGGDHVRADFVPVHRLGASTGGERLGRWWARVLAIPAAQNPIGVG